MNLKEGFEFYFAGWEKHDVPFTLSHSFYAGAAIGALGARMSQEEILKAVREVQAPAKVAPEWSQLFDAAMALQIKYQGDTDFPELRELRRAISSVMAL